MAGDEGGSVGWWGYHGRQKEQQAGMNEGRVSKQQYGWRRSKVGGRLDWRGGGWADHADCKSCMSLDFIIAIEKPLECFEQRTDMICLTHQSC